MSLVRLFQRPHYESDATQFIDGLKKVDATLEPRQRAGRGRLWDRHLDPEQQNQFRAAKVPQKDYVYYSWQRPR